MHTATLLLFLSAATPLFAQTAPYTLKTGTQRVLVDVVVTDAHNQPVHGLHQSDFTVLENHHPETLTSFDEHTALTPTQAAAVPAAPPLPPGQFTNYVPVRQSSALTVILFDRLNTGLRDQLYVHDQLVDYLKHARPDSRTAIFGLTDHLILLQGFTSDPAVLLRAIDTKKLIRTSPLRDDVIGGNAGVEDLSAASDAASAVNSPAAANIAAFQAQYQSFQSQIQGQYTLDALMEIGRSLSGISGRKNLIWFTGNFPQGFFPGDNDVNVPYGQFAGLDREFQQTVDLLTASEVAIYPVDAQGLRPNDNNNASLANHQFGSIKESSTRTGLAAATSIEREDAATAREHLGMDQLAHDTGGTAFYNHNDLSRAVDDAIASGSNYYTLAYNPNSGAGSEDNHNFRAIAVKLNGKSYKLSYRRGYYADALPHPRIPLDPSFAAPSRAPSLRTALLQGGPTPTEILLRVAAAPADAGPDPTLDEGNSPPDPTLLNGPFQSFRIDFAAGARELTVRATSDQRYHLDLSFITAFYDGKGRLLNAQSDTMRTSYTPAEMLTAFRSGVPFTQFLSIPESSVHSGAATLRVVVHDNLGDKVGAVEIPLDAIRHLPIAPTPAASQTSFSNPASR